MSNLDFKLVKDRGAYNTTIVDVVDRNTSYRCLIDTGAYMAIWCAGFAEFSVRFCDSKKLDLLAVVGGFGYGYTFAPVYEINQYVFSDGKDALIFHNLPIAIIDRADFSFPMVLGYSLFQKTNISINTYTNKGKQHFIHPHIIFNSIRNHQYVNPILVQDSDLNPEIQKYVKENGYKGVLGAYSVFAQN